MSSQQATDVRGFITPDAFSVDPSLLGTPLARPARRLFALLIDLVLVGFLQLLGWKLLGGVAALMFFRIATRKPEGTTPSLARKVASGCLGALVLVSVVTTLGVLPFMFGGGGDDDDVFSASSTGTSLSDVMGAVMAAGTLAEVDDSASAVDALVTMGRTMQSTDAVTGDELRASLEALMESNDELDGEEIVDAAIAILEGEEEAASVAEAVEPETDPGLSLLDSVAGDTLAALQSRIGRLESDLEDTETTLSETSDALAEAQESSLFSWVRDVADEAGLIFGWGTVYLTLFLALWGGRTPGKKMLGLRVVRLNGAPISLYLSLERAGGYAAGFATGLLGFAQVMWDPNRQGIHDKIAETVVVLEGAPKAPEKWIAPSQSEAAPGVPSSDDPLFNDS